MVKKSVLIVLAVALVGCANLKFQASASYMNDAMVEEVAAQKRTAQ